MSRSVRLLLTIVVACAVLPACGPRAPAPPPVTFTLDSIAPEAGASVTPDSVFRAIARYHIPHFAPGGWRVMLLFKLRRGDASLVAPPTTLNADVLHDSAGVFRINQPFRAMWGDAILARPFRITVMLANMDTSGHSQSVVMRGPFIYSPAPGTPIPYSASSSDMEGALGLLFAPVIKVHQQPFTALLPALAFATAVVAVRRRRRRWSWHTIVLGLVAVLWAAFTPYELHMLQWELTVHAPIRADLVLLAPFYWIVTLIGLVAALVGLRLGRAQPIQEAT